MRQDIWYKLWGNMTMNPVSALTGATVDRVLADPLVCEFRSAAMREAASIGARIGCPIAPDPDERHAMTAKLGAGRPCCKTLRPGARANSMRWSRGARCVGIDRLLDPARRPGERPSVGGLYTLAPSKLQHRRAESASYCFKRLFGALERLAQCLLLSSCRWARSVSWQLRRMVLKKTLIALALVACGQSVFAGPFQIAITSGSNALVITDNDASDLNNAAGSISYLNNNFNGWALRFVAGDSLAPGLNPFGLEMGVLAICTLTSGNCATQQLSIGIGDFLAFTEPATSFRTTYSGTLTGLAQGSYTEQYAAFNTLAGAPLPPAMAAGVFSHLGPYSSSFVAEATGGGPVTSTPYTLLIYQNFSGVGSYSVDGAIHRVPEPGTLALLAGGLLGAVGIRRYAKK